MRFVMVLVVACVACGPSSMQLKTAKTAEYKAAAQVIYELASEVAAETYNIDGSDPTAYVIVTVPQMYNREGGRQSPGAEGFVQYTPGSVLVSFHIAIVDVGLSRVAVIITPKTFEMLAGSPKPRELTPDDPSLPPWVSGRVDSLAIAIYERAKGYIEKP